MREKDRQKAEEITAKEAEDGPIDEDREKKRNHTQTQTTQARAKKQD